MAWRGLHLSRPSRLSLADGQIVVEQDDGVVRLALEDLAWIVIDTPRCSVTAALLSDCMRHGIAVIVSDETHTPCGVTLPFHVHHRQAGVAQLQASATAPLKKRLWQQIVRRKIENQASSLKRVDPREASALRAMALRVGSGDPENIEAQAARHYWSRLWTGFRREDEADRRNMLLNYGYAVLRSAVARSLVAVGLIPAFGLKHASVSNAFNLADDLLEPFRPFVDIQALALSGEGGEQLTLVDRQRMAGILLEPCRIENETVTLLNATEQSCQSLVRCLENKSALPLVLPVLDDTAAQS